MLSLISSALLPAAPLALVTYNFEAIFVYGLLAAVVGLIAWSKYTEPALSPAYPAAGPAAGAGADRAPLKTSAPLVLHSAESPAAGDELSRAVATGHRPGEDH